MQACYICTAQRNVKGFAVPSRGFGGVPRMYQESAYGLADGKSDEK
ncbi:hypothetical protein JKG47_16960 [Acidithiobacillus sp. MC6.1]|nr:hypothetical protein [Acidithiobacillus sp. MC6.1]